MNVIYWISEFYRENIVENLKILRTFRIKKIVLPHKNGVWVIFVLGTKNVFKNIFLYTYKVFHAKFSNNIIIGKYYTVIHSKTLFKYKVTLQLPDF